MKSIILKLCLIITTLGFYTSLQAQQINPNKDIKWPSTCAVLNDNAPWCASPNIPLNSLQYNNNGAFAGASGGTTNGTHFAFGPLTPVDDLGPSILTVEAGSGTPDTSASGTSALNTAITWNPTSNPLNADLYMISGVANFDLDNSGDAGVDASINGVNITINDNGNTVSPQGIVGVWTDATTTGTDSPGFVEGVESNIELADGGSNTTINPAIIGIATNHGFNAIGTVGVIGQASVDGPGTNLLVAGFLVGGNNISAGTVDDLSGMLIGADTVTGSTVTTDSAIHINATDTGGATNYAIFSESTDLSSFAGPIQSTTLTATGPAPTVASGQVGFGGTTVAASNCNQSGVLTGVAGCLVINVAGVTHYMPYF